MEVSSSASAAAVASVPALTAGQTAGQSAGPVAEREAAAEQVTGESNVAAEADGSAKGEETSEENALVATAEIAELMEDDLLPQQSVEARLPVQLNVGIPIRDFRVRNLVLLEPGVLIASQWAPGEDVPVASGDTQLAWSEFEVVEQQLAVRLTRLA